MERSRARYKKGYKEKDDLRRFYDCQKENLQILVEKFPPNSTIMNKIALQVQKIEEIAIYHIFRHLNMEADKLDNEGEMLRQGILELNQA